MAYKLTPILQALEDRLSGNTDDTAKRATTATRKSGGDTLVELLEKASGGKSRMSVERAYREVAWLRRAVKIRASAAASVPWGIYPGDSEDAVFTSEDGAPPKELVWARDMTRLIFMIDACTTLEARWYMQRVFNGENGGKLMELQWLNPKNVEEVYDQQTGQLTGFKRTVNNRPVDIGLDKMVYGYASDIYTEIGPGTADAKSALLHAEILNSLATFTDNHLDGGLLKATLISVARGTRKEERDKLEGWFNRYIMGKGRKEAKILEADTVNIDVIGDGLKDLQYKDLSEDERNSLSAATGVPVSLLSSSSTTFNHAEKDDLHLAMKTTIPSLRVYGAQLNKQLFNPAGYRLEFMTEMIPAVKKDMIRDANGIYRLTGGKQILTPDEARRIFFNLPPMEAQPEPPGQQTDVSQLEDAKMDAKAWKEFYQWRDKAKNKGIFAPFQHEHMPAKVVQLIKSRLERGEPLHMAFRVSIDPEADADF